MTNNNFIREAAYDICTQVSHCERGTFFTGRSINPTLKQKILYALFTGFVRVRGKSGKPWNFRISFSRPGKSWNLSVGHGGHGNDFY